MNLRLYYLDKECAVVIQHFVFQIRTTHFTLNYSETTCLEF